MTIATEMGAAVVPPHPFSLCVGETQLKHYRVEQSETSQRFRIAMR